MMCSRMQFFSPCMQSEGLRHESKRIRLCRMAELRPRKSMPRSLQTLQDHFHRQNLRHKVTLQLEPSQSRVRGCLNKLQIQQASRRFHGENHRRSLSRRELPPKRASVLFLIHMSICFAVSSDAESKYLLISIDPF